MARDATARLYDVDEDTVVFKKLDQVQKYDQGLITFRARKGQLIDLRKLHESIWATRLSGGTRSGLVRLVVTVEGQVLSEENQVVIRPHGSTDHFVLGQHLEQEYSAAFDQLRAALAGGATNLRVTGQLDGWVGRWPNLLRKPPPKPYRLLVTDFEQFEAQ